MAARKDPKEKERYPFVRRIGRTYYAYYRTGPGNAGRHRVSTGETERGRADAKLQEILRDLGQGTLRADYRYAAQLPFRKMGEEYKERGMIHLAPLSKLRNIQALDLHLVPYYDQRLLSTIGRRSVSEYINFRVGCKASGSTIHKEIACLSGLFEWARDEGLVHDNPVRGVKKPSVAPIRRTYCPNPGEIVAILSHMKPAPQRMALVLALTACRIGEISNARVQDFDPEQRILKVIRKGRQLRLIPLSERVCKLVQLELSGRTPDPEDRLFRFKQIKDSIAAACKRAGIPHCTHHSFRHGLATLLGLQHVPTRDIQNVLGHKPGSPVTESVYIRILCERVRQITDGIQLAQELTDFGDTSTTQPVM